MCPLKVDLLSVTFDPETAEIRLLIVTNHSAATTLQPSYSWDMSSCLLISTPNLWRHWTDLNQTWTHIHLWLLFGKFGSNSPRAGQKPLFRTDFKLWPNISLQRNVISTIEKKLVSRQGVPYMSPNLVNYGPETAKNGWWVFAHIPKSLHWETLPALPH